MPDRSSPLWLPRLLFRGTLGVAGALIALVVLAPVLIPGGPSLHGGWRLLALFAHDAAVRHTALASAAGLTVTAFVFFRVSAPAPTRTGARKPPRVPPGTNIVGA